MYVFIKHKLIVRGEASNGDSRILLSLDSDRQVFKFGASSVCDSHEPTNS